MAKFLWCAVWLTLSGCVGGAQESACGDGAVASRDDGVCRALCATNADCEGAEFCDGEVCRSSVAGGAANPQSASNGDPTESELAGPEEDDLGADGTSPRPTAEEEASEPAETGPDADAEEEDLVPDAALPDDEPDPDESEVQDPDDHVAPAGEIRPDVNTTAAPIADPVEPAGGHDDDSEEPPPTEPTPMDPISDPEPPVPDSVDDTNVTTDPAPAPAPACTKDLTNVTKLGPQSEALGLGVVGCPGQWTWANRAAACGPGWRVCSASDWVQKANQAPTHHYWTDTNLGWCEGTSCGSDDGIVIGTIAFAAPPPNSGGTTYVPPADQAPACMASTSADHSCGTNPMRVCWPGAKTYPSTNVVDGSGNLCNWTGCSLDGGGGGFSDYFGGCFGNETAGTLCCKDIVFDAWILE